jgi:hypothetical protein
MSIEEKIQQLQHTYHTLCENNILYLSNLAKENEEILKKQMAENEQFLQTCSPEICEQKVQEFRENNQMKIQELLQSLQITTQIMRMKEQKIITQIEYLRHQNYRSKNNNNNNNNNKIVDNNTILLSKEDGKKREECFCLSTHSILRCYQTKCCKHIIGKTCLKSWFNKHPNNKTCPYCRCQNPNVFKYVSS